MPILYISGLPPSISVDYLKQRFAPFGQVISVRVGRTLDGCCVGSATIEMSSQEDVDEILSTKDRISIDGKRPNIWQSSISPPQPAKDFEVLIRWVCACPPASCPNCNGKGYLEEWVPMNMMKSLKGLPFIIRSRRYVTPP
jgi:hypothetical protein